MQSEASRYSSILQRPLVPFGIALLAHGRGLWNGFALDDASLLRESSDLRRLSGLWRLLTSPREVPLAEPGARTVYRPIAAAVDWLGWQLARADHLTQHAVGIVAHAFVAALMFRLLVALGVSRRGALAAACLFAAHPLAADCVAAIGSRSLIIGSAILLAGAAPRPQNGLLRNALLGFLTSLLAIGCHEALAFSPLVFAAAHCRTLKCGAPACCAAPLGAVLAVILFLSHSHWNFPELPAALVLSTGSALVVRFARLAVLPIGMSPFVTLPHVGAWLIPGICLIAVLGMLWSVRRRLRLIATHVGLVIALGAALSFAPAAARSTGSDRGAYVFLLGSLLALAPALASLLPDRRAQWRMAIPVAIAVLLSPLAWHHHASWKNDTSLLKGIVASGPSGAGTPEVQLASAMLAFEAGDLFPAAACVPYVMLHREALRAYLCAGTLLVGGSDDSSRDVGLALLRAYSSRYPFLPSARRAISSALLSVGAADELRMLLKRWEVRYRSAPDVVETRAELARRGLL